MIRDSVRTSSYGLVVQTGLFSSLLLHLVYPLVYRISRMAVLVDIGAHIHVFCFCQLSYMSPRPTLPSIDSQLNGSISFMIIVFVPPADVGVSCLQKPVSLESVPSCLVRPFVLSAECSGILSVGPVGTILAILACSFVSELYSFRVILPTIDSWISCLGRPDCPGTVVPGPSVQLCVFSGECSRILLLAVQCWMILLIDPSACGASECLVRFRSSEAGALTNPRGLPLPFSFRPSSTLEPI